MFRFTSVAVKYKIEENDSQYTENGHSTYPGTMGDHGLWEGEGGRERMGGGEKEERRKGGGWKERRKGGGEKGRRREGGKKGRERGEGTGNN